MIIDQASVDSHFPPLLNYVEDMRLEEEKIDQKIKQAQRFGSSHRLRASSTSGHFGIEPAGNQGSSDTEQMSQNQNPLSPQPHHRMSRKGSCLPDLFRKKEQAAKMEVFDFKLLKYKRSSVFFWFKPISQADQRVAKNTHRSSQAGDDVLSTLNQYPNSDHQARQRTLEMSGDLTEHFKVSVKAIKNLGVLIGKLKSQGPIKV